MNRTKKSEIPQNIVYFDSESRVEMDDSKYIDQVMSGETVEKIHDCFLICACFSRPGNINDKWKDYYDNNFKKKFWNDVDRFTAAGRKTWVFAHNARYDVLVTGAAKYLVAAGYTVVGFSDDNPFILRLVKKENDKNKTILIISSTNYYKNSLAELGKTFNLPKLDAAFNDSLENAITYCRRDVEILKAAMEGLINFIVEEDLGPFAQTIAGQSFSAFRHKFMNHDIYIHTDIKALEIERESYCGGRTEAWHIGTVPGTVYGVDINSEYPAVMLGERYPVFLKTIRKTLAIDDLLTFIDQGYLVVCRARVETDLPLFPVKAGRLIFPVGSFWTTLATPELLEGIRRGFVKELKDVCIYEAEPIFYDFVDYFYNRRLEAKKNNDPVRTYLYKLILNSLYGKFGQKAIDWELIGEAPPDEIKVERIINFDTGKREMVKIFGGSVFKNIEKQGPDQEAANSFPAIAAHVTSYARVLLWRYAETAGLENVYYMDTDSIFTNETGYKNLEAAEVISETRLGDLKLEKTGELTIFGVKDYIFNGAAKTKGIPKSAIKINDTTYIVNTWIGMSKMIAGGSVEGYKNVLVKKELKRRYTKGSVLEGGKINPLVMYNDQMMIDPGSLNFADLRTEYLKDEIKLEKEQDRIQALETKKVNKKFRKNVIELGGVNDPAYENLPRWCKRKKGSTLDIIKEDLFERGYPLEDSNNLFEMLWNN